MEQNEILSENSTPIAKIIHLYLVDPEIAFSNTLNADQRSNLFELPYVSWRTLYTNIDEVGNRKWESSYEDWYAILNNIQLTLSSNLREIDEKEDGHGFQMVTAIRKKQKKIPAWFYLFHNRICRIKDMSYSTGEFFNLENFQIKTWIYSYNICSDLSLDFLDFFPDETTMPNATGSIFELEDTRWMVIQIDAGVLIPSIVVSHSLNDLVRFGLTQEERKRFRIKLFPNIKVHLFLQNFFLCDLCQIIIEYTEDYFPSEYVALHLLFQSPTPPHKQVLPILPTSSLDDDNNLLNVYSKDEKFRFGRESIFSNSTKDKIKRQVRKHQLSEKKRRKHKIGKQKKVKKYKQLFTFHKKQNNTYFNFRKLKHKHLFELYLELD